MSKAPARLRGSAAGLLTAALTLAAHSVGGGELPLGVTAIQLLVIAAAVGGLASSSARAGDARVLGALLAAGQVAGHAVLAVHGDHHGTGAPPWAMVAAHVGATVAAASLIGVGDRLCRALSQAIRASAPSAPPPVSAAGTAALRTADQPMRAALVLASSISHRGPPVAESR